LLDPDIVTLSPTSRSFEHRYVIKDVVAEALEISKSSDSIFDESPLIKIEVFKNLGPSFLAFLSVSSNKELPVSTRNMFLPPSSMVPEDPKFSINGIGSTAVSWACQFS
jgi:hypothetical protein